jgi:hypothetical protein
MFSRQTYVLMIDWVLGRHVFVAISIQKDTFSLFTYLHSLWDSITARRLPLGGIIDTSICLCLTEILYMTIAARRAIKRADIRSFRRLFIQTFIHSLRPITLAPSQVDV